MHTEPKGVTSRDTNDTDPREQNAALEGSEVVTVLQQHTQQASSLFHLRFSA